MTQSRVPMQTGESGKSSWSRKMVGDRRRRRETAARPREKMVCPGNQCGFFRIFVETEGEKPMADQSAANLAFERAWSVYLLINSGVDENDERRTTLERFIRKNCEAGENDPETLTVGGLSYLKKLDEIEKYSFR